MPGFILHLGATVTCSHGGQATPAEPFTRVLVSGQPVVSQSSSWLIAGCRFVPPELSHSGCAAGPELPWGKALPTGHRFDLGTTTPGTCRHHKSGAGEFSLGSDSVAPALTCPAAAVAA